VSDCAYNDTTHTRNEKAIDWLRQLPFEYVDCGPLPEAWLAATGNEERACLLEDGVWPESPFSNRTVHESLRDIESMIAAALKHEAIQLKRPDHTVISYSSLAPHVRRSIRVAIVCGESAFSSNRKLQAFTAWISKSRDEIVTPRREVFEFVCKQYSPVDAEDEVSKWHKHIMDQVRVVERSHRPQVRFERERNA